MKSKFWKGAGVGIGIGLAFYFLSVYKENKETERVRKERDTFGTGE
ncbi:MULTISPECIES: hypothetical protein [Bacillaceae]|uniref:Uncharacterized protein n=1 Tax=Evansella alkalicola TaxID=745819 RepID=A0ABS6JS11_9BACI|nr:MULTISPECIES: hypothetical protein [Bacillaceae]MBU9721361.1 hypothetical protein [Bacillus alkalicola]